MSEASPGRRRTSWRRWWLPLLGTIVLALAGWVRSPVANIAFRAEIRDANRRAATQLASESEALVRRLRAAVERAVELPAAPGPAFARAPTPRAGEPEWGLVVYDSDAAIAWSGRIRIPADTVRAPFAVVQTPFYTIVAISATRGARRAVAMGVIDARAPADRLSHAVTAIVRRRADVRGFSVQPSPAAGVPVLRSPTGETVLAAQVRALSPGELRLQRVQRERKRVAMALAAALLAFLVLAWRIGTLGERLGASAIAVAALAIVPFNTFSADARLFDPTYYYARFGGPWTANAGVLLLTAVVVVLTVLGVVRSPRRLRSRPAALAAAGVIAVAGVFVVRALAEGIGQPARGATTALWLSWEIPLFLAVLAFALPVAWIADTVGRRRRALTRRGFLAAAVASAVIASTLVWLTTIGQRMRLAEADVTALDRGADDYLDALLARFVGDLRANPPAADRVELLRRYAESELAIAGYPFELAAWDAGGRRVGSVDLTRGAADAELVAPVVAAARASDSIVVRKVAGPLGAMWIAAVPHANAVTSVAALPRSRVVEPDPFAALLGLPAEPPDEAPYSISIADDEWRTPAPLRWTRTGSELHGDAPLRTSRGPVRAHVELDFRSVEALGQRLLLVVLLNVLVAGALLLLVRIGERGFGRRVRVRVRHWRRSYRARLTLALFAFFVVPAGAFAVWGYRRLVADNRNSRELVVGETLHAAAAAGSDAPVPEVARRLATPLFVYHAGALTASSDSLLDALAPLGRMLPPGVHLNLDVADELTASWEEPIAGTRVLTGYRSTVRDGAEAVLAAPARAGAASLARRGRDLAILLLFATATGALAALWLSGVAAHQFGRPISALRRAARALARGDRRPPSLPKAPSEFQAVFTAFGRMSADLERSRVEQARAERVLAWGEMARQVAHEIKNPLTPMRLGIQYLQRAKNDPRVNFDEVFAENTRRMLEEIERLDEIARAFSRYGSAPTDLPPPERVDVAAVLRDVVAFERMGAGGVEWRLTGADAPAHVVARPEELREVLMNVFENARAAQARVVTVELRRGDRDVAVVVADDGTGIDAEALPRIFEPHFSTRTTGSGLGLAISRRLLDAWGASISITSALGEGTTVSIKLATWASHRDPSESALI